jgi:hypothetical protein
MCSVSPDHERPGPANGSREFPYSPDRELEFALAFIASTREFCKTMLTTTAALMASYVALLAWVLPRTGPGSLGHIADWSGAACLALPVLQFAYGMMMYAFAYFAANWEGPLPSTSATTLDYHRIQLKWIRAASLLLAMGLVVAFAILSAHLARLPVDIVAYIQWASGGLSGGLAVYMAISLRSRLHGAAAIAVCLVLPLAAAGAIVANRLDLTRLFFIGQWIAPITGLTILGLLSVELLSRHARNI